MEIDGKIKELEARLAELRRQRDAEIEAVRASVQPIWQYILKPYSESGWDRIADPSCRYFRLEGNVVNSDALQAVGARVPDQGGMTYLFNTLSGRFVISAGGGQVILRLTDGGFGPADAEAFRELEILLYENPDVSHDVSGVVERAHARREG